MLKENEQAKQEVCNSKTNYTANFCISFLE